MTTPTKPSDKEFWRAIEDVALSGAVEAMWRQWLGDGFPTIRSAFFRNFEKPAEVYPCPGYCGCQHDVICHDDGKIVGVCSCNPWNCDDIKLTKQDLVVYGLSLNKLSLSLARAFGFETTPLNPTPGTQLNQIGTFGGQRMPILLCVWNNWEPFYNVLTERVARMRDPFILLTPTGRRLDPRCRELLTATNSGAFALDEHVNILGNGTLHCPQSAGQLFSAYLPKELEMADKSEASRVIAMLQQLRSEHVGQKAALYEVFSYLVLDGCSQKETARRCKCSTGLISQRVAELELRFNGLSVEQLRNYASDILESSVLKGDRRGKKQPHDPSNSFD